MPTDPDQSPTEDATAEQALTPLAAADASSDTSLWDRTKLGLGKVATKVAAAAGSTVASAASTAKSGAVSAATKATTTGASTAASAAKSAVAAGGQVATATGLDKAVEYLDSTLDERGVKKAIGSAAGAVVDRLDQVTGKQLVELLEARLRLQDEYNDALASRLAEALERIAALEEKLRHGHS